MIIRCLYDRLVPVSELLPHPENANVHPPDQIERLAEILKYQGWRYPIKVSKQSGFISSGHGRLMAAAVNGWKEVPVNFQDYDDEAQEFADVHADNAIASWAELDLSKINLDFTKYGPDLDLKMLGLKDFVLDISDKLDPGCDEDEVPENVEPKTKRGDIYRLGSHRLMCGDSTSIDDVERLMAGEKASFVFTSPPYNGDTSMLEGSFGNKNVTKTLYRDNSTDAKSSAEYIQFNRDIFAAIKAIASDDITICYNINYNKKSPSEYIDIVNDAKCIFPLRETVIWEKQMAVSLQGHNFTRIYEFVFVFGASELVMNKQHTACVKNLWKISNINANTGDHKACFPVALPRQGIELLSRPGAVIFEPFGGSGTTMIAAEDTGRSAHLMELDPHYCDVIVARWEKFTGKKAELLTTP